METTSYFINIFVNRCQLLQKVIWNELRYFCALIIHKMCDLIWSSTHKKLSALTKQMVDLENSAFLYSMFNFFEIDPR